MGEGEEGRKEEFGEEELGQAYQVVFSTQVSSFLDFYMVEMDSLHYFFNAKGFSCCFP